MTLHTGHSIPVTSDKADLYRRQKLLYTEHRINGSGYQKSLSCAQCNSVTIPLFIKRMSQRISLKEAPKGILRINGRRFRCSYTRIACRFVPPGNTICSKHQSYRIFALALSLWVC